MRRAILLAILAILPLAALYTTSSCASSRACSCASSYSCSSNSSKSDSGSGTTAWLDIAVLPCAAGRIFFAPKEPCFFFSG